jgi:hypothetical protein
MSTVYKTVCTIVVFAAGHVRDGLDESLGLNVQVDHRRELL